jgi:signal transduction histidine kinase
VVRNSGPRWTTTRWLVTLLGSALVVLCALGILAGWATVRSTEVSDRLTGDTSPALIEAVRLEAALVNQETGVRGYGLTGQLSFLDPYTQGLTQESDSVATLRGLVAGDRTAAADLDRVVAAAQVWQAQLARPVAAATGPDAIQVATRLADRGKTSFDAVRAALTTQQAHIGATRAAETAELNRVFTERDWILGAAGVVVLLLIGFVFEGLRRAVTAPLSRLSADALVVTSGDFHHPIAATGPADLRVLARGVEAMRGRLVDELAFADGARSLMDEQAVELRRSNAELEQFAYVASHDLQEPLRKVASFCQLLQRRYAENLDERANQYIAFAVDGATRMQTLINDLLSFSRVGRLHTENSSVSLDDVTKTVLGGLSLAVEDAEALVTHDPLPTIAGDRTQLEMLFHNLLGNAVKFRTPDRPPRIHIEAVRDGERWRMAVADNGIGIDPEFAPKVFTIFQRLHTRDAYPGNGIGLALCKKIVEFHGGAIAIDPDYTPGTRVTFDLPAADDAATADGTDTRGNNTGETSTAAERREAAR